MITFCPSGFNQTIYKLSPTKYTGVVVRFDPISYEIGENSGAVNISLVASAPLSQAYMVVINTKDGTAIGQ